MDTGLYGAEPANSQPIYGDPGISASTATLPMPKFDTDKTLRFVLPLIGSGRIAVAAIHPVTGKCHGRTFTLPDEQAEFFIWVEKRQIEWNLHFNLNRPVPQSQQEGKSGRILKSDLSTLLGVVVDIDPSKEIEAQPGGFERERKRLVAQALRWADDPNGPSAIIDSGGGVQAVYLFPEPLPATDENIAAVEAQSRGLGELYGGDATHDAVHLFRLPHTINWPNATKRARGRKPAETLGWVVGPRRWHTLESLAKLAPPIAKEDIAAPAPPFNTVDAWAAAGSPISLSDELAEQIEAACARHTGFERLLSGSAPPSGSQKRSEHDFALACACVEAGITDRRDVAAVVAAYGSDKYEEKLEGPGRGSADSYLVNTVNKAFAKVEAAKADNIALLSPVEDVTGTADEAQAAAVAFGDGEPIDLFGGKNPAAAATALVDALPGPIARHVRALAARMGTPEDFAAVTAVAVLAAAIGGALKLRVHEHDADFEVTALIAVVLVGRPGRKKTPLVKALMKALRAINAELHARSAAQWAQWRAAHCTAKGTPKPGAPPPPPWQQVIVDNATVEKLIAIIADNPGGLLIDPDELMAFLGSMDAYKKSGGGDRSIILRVIDGSAVSLERKSGSTHSAGAPTGMVATTQPDKIRTLTRDLGSDGFLQRLIFVMDDGVEREGIDAPADPHAAAEYGRAVRAMFEIRHSGGGTVLLSPDARAVLTATWRRIRALQALPGASAAWEGHVSKWEGFLYRIALTFHALDTWAEYGAVLGGPNGVPVTAETARRASRFALALVGHALRFYGEYYEPAEDNVEAREIAGYLLAHPDVLSVTPRDIEKARRSLHKQRRLTLAAMGALETANWVSVAGRGADGPTKWTVNPRIHEQFAELAVREKQQRAEAQRRALAAMSAQKGLNDAV